VQWLHHERQGERDSAAAILQRLCAEPSSAFASILLNQPAADSVQSAAKRGAIQERAAMLLKVATLRQRKMAVAAGACDANKIREKLCAANAFSASATLLQEISFTEDPADVAAAPVCASC
jgi:hypothetical protein